MEMIMEGLYNANSHCDVHIIDGSQDLCDSGKDY